MKKFTQNYFHWVIHVLCLICILSPGAECLCASPWPAAPACVCVCVCACACVRVCLRAWRACACRRTQSYSDNEAGDSVLIPRRAGGHSYSFEETSPGQPPSREKHFNPGPGAWVARKSAYRYVPRGHVCGLQIPVLISRNTQPPTHARLQTGYGYRRAGVRGEG